MAGIQADKCPTVKIPCIPTVLPDAVNKPQTMYDVEGKQYSEPTNYVTSDWTYNQGSDFRPCSWDGKPSTMPANWTTSELPLIGEASVYEVGGDGSGLSGGAIAGIVLAVVAVLLVIGGLLWWKFWKPKNLKQVEGSNKGTKKKAKELKKKNKGSKKKIFVSKKETV